MQYVINLNSVLPIRVTPSEAAEMVTQLLFGEYGEVLGEENNFIRIKNYNDGYEGWADEKMLTEISKEDYDRLRKQDPYRVSLALAEAISIADSTTFRLPMGSLLPDYTSSGKFGINKEYFLIQIGFVTHSLPEDTVKENIIHTSKKFLNAPYLWGGKSVLGIDCSGLVQVIFSVNGILLPRDASQQATKGKKIKYENREPGDLFFFSKNEKITHVGIYIGNELIIHASGKVRIDHINERGIYRKEDLLFTHSLTMIKRVI